MKKIITVFCFAFLLFAVSASAQTKEEEDLPIEQILEIDAKHNLAVGWQYYKKKAYWGVLKRVEETLAAHPGFTKMDEILYLAGISSHYLSIGKGKQKLDVISLSEEDKERYTKVRLRDDAIGFLNQLVEQHSTSKYSKKARKALKKIENSTAKILTTSD